MIMIIAIVAVTIGKMPIMLYLASEFNYRACMVLYSIIVLYRSRDQNLRKAKTELGKSM